MDSSKLPVIIEANAYMRSSESDTVCIDLTITNTHNKIIRNIGYNIMLKCYYDWTDGHEAFIGRGGNYMLSNRVGAVEIKKGESKTYTVKHSADIYLYDLKRIKYVEIDFYVSYIYFGWLNQDWGDKYNISNTDEKNQKLLDIEPIYLQ